MSNYKKLIDNMRWSFSRITLFEHCKYAFYLKYILNDDEAYLDENNYYAEVGSFVHSILEKILKNELSVDKAPEYYLEHFDDNVFYTVKPSTMEKTYEICADYFAELDLDWLKDYEIIGVEKKVETKICGYDFLGFIDLLLLDKKTGNIIIVDHKSSAYPFKKDGKTVLKKAEENFESYKRQMYLYANAVYQEYGVYPTELWWNHFKDGKIAKIKFNSDDYYSSLQWFQDTIKRIREEEDFEGNLDFFYCKELCNYRNCCEYRTFNGE